MISARGGHKVKVAIFAANSRAERRLRARFQAWGMLPVRPGAEGEPPDVVVVAGPEIGPLLDQVERWLPKFRSRPPIVAVNV
ncbi:MAG: hypothetical protein RMK15_07925, partial [Chloroflexota bacterium]|nr:hypothetical protein [Chloroflexota bacterium]